MALKAPADALLIGSWDNGLLRPFPIFRVLSAAI